MRSIADPRSDPTPRGATGVALREGLELVAETRLSLPLNVSEELALEALSYRLEATLAA